MTAAGTSNCCTRHSPACDLRRPPHHPSPTATNPQVHSLVLSRCRAETRPHLADSPLLPQGQVPAVQDAGVHLLPGGLLPGGPGLPACPLSAGAAGGAGGSCHQALQELCGAGPLPLQAVPLRAQPCGGQVSAFPSTASMSASWGQIGFRCCAVAMHTLVRVACFALLCLLCFVVWWNGPA